MMLSSDTAMVDAARGEAADTSGPLLQEALVVAHHQLRLELFHRVERDADDDQDRGATEEEVGAGLVDEDRRQGRDRRQVEGPGEGQRGEDAIEDLGRWPAGSPPRDEPAVFL